LGEKFAPELARWDGLKQDVHKKERVAAKIEKKLDENTSNLIEYTKWMSN